MKITLRRLRVRYDSRSFSECCDAIVSAVSEIREQRRTIVFLVPKYGRYIVPERPSASQQLLAEHCGKHSCWRRCDHDRHSRARLS